ncbi:hypothetical protein N665_0071s0001 [Sinapis alba]|nr:hypothetical protein N665_0071s0001 [Sinapis alba]
MWRVKVKIIHLWRQYSAGSRESIEMVFVDARVRDKIHGTVKEEEVDQFSNVLIQGQTKVLINFTVTHSGGSYRSTIHPYKVVFLPTTRVRNCEALPNNLTGIEPVNYRDVLNGRLDSDFLVDVISQVVEVSHIEVVAVNGKDTQKITVELHNEEDECLSLVLWGKFAADNTIICVVRFGKIKVWKEERSISNAYNVSDVSLNPTMDEVEAFMRLLPKDELSVAFVDSKPLKLASGVSEKDDFFVHTPRKTIAEVLESKLVEKCIVMASVAEIESDMGWYYLSCKVCAKKVLTVPNDTLITVMYKLHLVMLDNTANCKFLLFDNLALQLFHTPCIELTGPITDEDLVGKNFFFFKIGIERENFLYKHDTFKVLKIITNIAMINEFDSTTSPVISESNDLTPAKRIRPPTSCLSS